MQSRTNLTLESLLAILTKVPKSKTSKTQALRFQEVYPFCVCQLFNFSGI